jgi:antitoxin (DNA-binding transcriptional repressor) of toxin-antitoxin stability system
METTLSLEAVAPALKPVLEHLSPGETVTLVNEAGTPVAVVTPLPPPLPKLSEAEWWVGWKVLGKEIDAAWQGSKSAVDTPSEMRR